MSATGAAAAVRPYLRVRNLSKAFLRFPALRDVSLDIAEGEFVCVLGPSGCGKTTFLRAIAGLDIQTSGTIEQAARDISALPPSERDYGIVFQSYALFPNLTVEKNIAYGLENAGTGRREVKARVAELLALVGLADHGTKYPAQLSGGQQQRVALARALATSPGLLLLDEPLSALDAKVRVHLRHEIRSLQKRLGVTTVMVTHDQEEALAMADRIVVMNQGAIEQVGTPTEIYREPRSLFVADFIGEANKLPGTALDAERVRIGAGELRCCGHSIAAGSEAVVVVRPEDILPIERLAAPQAEVAEAGRSNAFAARVAELEFLGAHWRAHLDGRKLDGVRLAASFSINDVRRLDIAQDALIRIELPPERIRAFPALAG